MMTSYLLDSPHYLIYQSTLKPTICVASAVSALRNNSGKIYEAVYLSSLKAALQSSSKKTLLNGTKDTVHA